MVEDDIHVHLQNDSAGRGEQIRVDHSFDHLDDNYDDDETAPFHNILEQRSISYGKPKQQERQVRKM